jgi:hypothetical protein
MELHLHCPILLSGVVLNYAQGQKFLILWRILPHASTVESQKQPLLSNTRTQQWNNGVMQPVSRQQLCKHVSTRNNGNCVSVDK